MILDWLFGDSDPGHVSPWNPVIAERHAAQTARMLLGACGPVRRVGNRREEAILADRERRAAQMVGRARFFRMGRLGRPEMPRSVA
ncbi:MAG: hypothetical protein IT179_13715 [Acidobacteria bacterium]|nr:hypothetical protein [Acidobacteriota bacterium]